MDRRTPLALLETRGRLITETTYFPSLLEGCAAQTLSASGLQAPVSNVRFGSVRDEFFDLPDSEVVKLEVHFGGARVKYLTN